MLPVLVVAALIGGLVFGLGPLFGSGLATGPTRNPAPTVAPTTSVEPSIAPPEGAGPFHPKTYREGGSLVMPVTFPDGTTAEVLYPEELGTGSIAPFAYLEGAPDECSPNVKLSRFGIVGNWSRPRPPLAVFEEVDGDPVGFWDGLKWAEPWDVLAFDFGRWVGVILCQADPVEDADALALVARSFDAREAEDGFLVVNPRAPLRLVRAGDQVGPRILFVQEVPGRDLTLVELEIHDCAPSAVELNQGTTAHGCLEGGIGVYAVGEREFLREVAAGLRVRNVDRPRG